MERWVPIPKWPLYEVSDHGRVRSWKPHYKTKTTRRKFPLYISPHLITQGYHLVRLTDGYKVKNGRRKFYYIHRLVALCFVAGDTTLNVAHLDGSRNNNYFKNLKWCTQKENMSHTILHGTKTENEFHGSTKLSNDSVRAILKMHKMGFGPTDIAFIFNVSDSLICDYIAGRTRFDIVGKRTRRTEIEANVIKRQL